MTYAVYDGRMTRINVIPVHELSDQHLIAEYHELPRVIKQNINTCTAPDCYVLGTGHMRWACRHWQYVYRRFAELCTEMEYRGFRVNFPPTDLAKYLTKFCGTDGEYAVQEADIALNRARLKEKYNKKPSFYKWTKRPKPDWL
ncbi:MAG: hypothetical protein J5611_02930 [Alphaproteobacteria bacterium]|nr:hypothetical protein [Alphaproteobacteria bacterium]